ncbi:hypothetical protein Y032_0619g728 [Ancylostoma ceylanicum]|uniref:Uncharacterized protein n=1 Tax=Ancylostoma ceylanicum TaxID=53326 RepID=A0A016WM03_9BILA|nr:hypothetical protein Y032_0619g728 [Ancylostoma ceylanicum]
MPIKTNVQKATDNTVTARPSAAASCNNDGLDPSTFHGFMCIRIRSYDTTCKLTTKRKQQSREYDYTKYMTISAEFKARPIPEFAQRLTGQDLVDYINIVQPFFEADYNEMSEEELRSRLMNKKYIHAPEERADELVLAEKIPER